MRVLLIISLLFSFVEIGFVDLAHAGEHDHTSIGHLDDNDVVSTCQQNGHEDRCNDCCCGHTHSTANLSTLTISEPLNTKQHNIADLTDHHPSADLPGLFRPPRF